MGLPYWIDFFDDLQHVRGRSLNTVMAYRRDLELYLEFRKSSSYLPGIYAFMKSKGLSDRSQARVISSLRTYFKFLDSKGESTPELKDLRPPKVKSTLPRALTQEEFHKLMEASRVEDSYKSARNQITLLLLYGTGCRVTELIQLDLNDFHPTDARLHVMGKGGKQRVVPLTEYLNSEVKAYLEYVRPHLTDDESLHSILVNDRGARPSRVDIWRWLAAWSSRAGFDAPVSPHQFRHGCATALLESGADLRSIQLLLGHASLQTTQIYTSVSSQKLTDTIAESHPLSKSKDL